MPEIHVDLSGRDPLRHGADTIEPDSRPCPAGGSTLAGAVLATTLVFASLLGPPASALTLSDRTSSPPAEPTATDEPVRRYDTAERISQVGDAAKSRLLPYFELAGVPYPPASVVLAGLKKERRLDLYAAGPYTPMRFIRSYYTRGQSGVAGPKLRQGDGQVPEGLYRLTALNPNSRFHLSMRVSYPNEFDMRMAILDEREDLGGDIFIHGGMSSVGCLAMGDPAIEELFVLAAETGLEAFDVILSPHDFRERPAAPAGVEPWWTPDLYRDIARALESLPPATWPDFPSISPRR